ncbi:hypothetical protein [Opitutus terrae]|uniref:Uncharacterized protein n=1 Tax=Opitutus terrae (strain DSM 11246 / JCM 15787 / PB90-1) TaxID=452637 RepID=B1ZWG4_OPITP|nr:hypothetical protein [Opitutus terrae]ACB76916.1 hypothetical protein Oter_3639 [Opitutus terrae PB90-1]
MLSRSSPSSAPRIRSAGVSLLLLALVAGLHAQSVAVAPAENGRRPSEFLESFIDRLPELLDIGLPSFAPPGAVRLYAHPRLGDLIHEDYFRLPVGARVKVNERVELRAELGTYFTHGLGDSVGYGLYQGRIGITKEHVLWRDAGLSTSLEFVTPLSRPPREITDGVRHTLPSITFTRTVVPRWGMVGFATVGLDLIDHTVLEPNFRENQLRQNSAMVMLGVAREWRRMHLILRVFDANTAPMGYEAENVFGIRPSIGVPLLRRDDGTPRATATFEGRAIWGPDGFETGVTTRIRVDLRYRPGESRRKQRAFQFAP